jgi:chromosome segregation ATPase
MFVWPMTHDTVSLREFFEEKFKSQSDKIDDLRAAITELASSIVAREYFDELSRDVADLDEKHDALEAELDKVDQRLHRQEAQLALIRWVMTGTGAVMLPLIIEKLQELFN